MSFYNKNACPVCEKTFEPSDEIVVCPECGTRYHKACYQQAGACLFQNRHGEEIPPDEDTTQDTNPNGENTQEGDTLVCPRCQTPNPSENIFCNRCGTALRAPFNQGFGANPNMGQNPNVPPFNPFVYAPSEQELKEEIDGVTVKELITNVGPNAQYYVPRFQLFSRQKGPGISPNWSAFFFNFFFFFYRKMYAIGQFCWWCFWRRWCPRCLWRWI